VALFRELSVNPNTGGLGLGAILASMTGDDVMMMMMMMMMMTMPLAVVLLSTKVITQALSYCKRKLMLAGVIMIIDDDYA